MNNPGTRSILSTSSSNPSKFPGTSSTSSTSNAPPPGDFSSEFQTSQESLSDAHIKVIGVGGGGGNAVQHMIDMGVCGVEFICANTDAQALKRSTAHKILQLGSSGLGAGARPEMGEICANEAQDKIREALTGAQMVFITAGLGGGTGTGSAPIIAKIAKELGILTVGVVTKPFEFEGARRTKHADAGLLELEKSVDSLIVILNDRLMEVMGEDVTQEAAFRAANDVLRSAVGGITNVIQMPGLINVDFEDVKTVMEQPGRAMMGTAQCTGPDRAIKAAEQAIACPLLEGIDLSGANGVLVLIAASRESYRLQETRNVMNAVRRYAHSDAHVIMGAAFEEELGNEMRVTVIATGLSSSQREMPRFVPVGVPSELQSRQSHGHEYQPSEMRGMLQREQVNDAGQGRHKSNYGHAGHGSHTERDAPHDAAIVHLRSGTDNFIEHPIPASVSFQPISRVQEGFSGSSGVPVRRAMDFPSRVSASPVIPAVWRNARTSASAKVNALSASGMDEMDIPAFLRKQAD